MILYYLYVSFVKPIPYFSIYKLHTSLDTLKILLLSDVLCFPTYFSFSVILEFNITKNQLTHSSGLTYFTNASFKYVFYSSSIASLDSTTVIVSLISCSSFSSTLNYPMVVYFYHFHYYVHLPYFSSALLLLHNSSSKKITSLFL